MHFFWKNEYKTDIDEIDEQHKNFLGIINDLHSAILKKEADIKLKQIFDRLIEYAKKHFETEERYFKEFNYEDADEHIIEHNKLTDRLNELYQQLDTNKTVLSFALVDFLMEWLSDHMERVDQKYIKCFKEHGK